MFEKNGLDKLADEIIKLLVGIALSAAAHQKKLEGQGGILDANLSDYITEELVKTGRIETITHAIEREYHEYAFINHNAVWKFITRLGSRLHTNFGFMFDWKTGEPYLEDDPKKR